MGLYTEVGLGVITVSASSPVEVNINRIALVTFTYSKSEKRSSGI